MILAFQQSITIWTITKEAIDVTPLNNNQT